MSLFGLLSHAFFPLPIHLLRENFDFECTNIIKHQFVLKSKKKKEFTVPWAQHFSLKQSSSWRYYFDIEGEALMGRLFTHSLTLPLSRVCLHQWCNLLLKGWNILGLAPYITFENARFFTDCMVISGASKFLNGGKKFQDCHHKKHILQGFMGISRPFLVPEWHLDIGKVSKVWLSQRPKIFWLFFVILYNFY